MGLARTFTRFDPAWILYEDAQLIALHKPAGMPSQSARPDAPDDARHRLSRYLAERAAASTEGAAAMPALELGRDGLPYLGVHQRLDQETSGVLLFSKARAANPGLAQQFEGRRVDKRYVAWLSGEVGQLPPTLRLTDSLAPGRGGLMEVRPPGRRDGQRAVTHVRIGRLEGGYALADIRIETGRTHQIRAQLAARSLPLVGDTLYGGPPAPRLMLHAEELRLQHPLTGAALRLRSPALPTELQLEGVQPGLHPDALAGALRAALRRAGVRRYGLFADHQSGLTTAFRLLHEEGDGVAGVAVDVYGEHLLVHFRDEALGAHEDTVLDVLAELGGRGVYVKRRPKQANELGDTRTDELAPERPARGEPTQAPEITVHEEGVPYRVRLADGLSTGLFLDQRANRRRVRELARGRAVLNLFAYTGPFTVAAVAGGAASTCTVDVAAPALSWAEAQVRALADQLGAAGADVEGLTGLDPARHTFVRADVFTWLRARQHQGPRFELVIVDPPTYSKTKRTRWTSGNDWVELVSLAASVAADEGVLLLCSNDRRMGQQLFRRHIKSGLAAVGRTGRVVDGAATPDFPPPPGGATMKSCVVYLDVATDASAPGDGGGAGGAGAGGGRGGSARGPRSRAPGGPPSRPERPRKRKARRR